MSNLDIKINSLQPSASIKISSCNGITVTAERTGDGKKVKFVRTQANGSWEVFHTSSF